MTYMLSMCVCGGGGIKMLDVHELVAQRMYKRDKNAVYDGKYQIHFIKYLENIEIFTSAAQNCKKKCRIDELRMDI